MIRIEPKELERLAIERYGKQWRIDMAERAKVNISTIWRWRRDGMPVKYEWLLK